MLISNSPSCSILVNDIEFISSNFVTNILSLKILLILFKIIFIELSFSNFNLT